MDFLNFDATQVKPAEGRTLLPQGTYRFAITGAELKPTKKGDGKYVKVECTVLEGEHKNRKLWPIFNLQNPNPEAQRIGQEQFSALCHAIGRLKIGQTADLVGGTFTGDVRVKQGKNDTEPNNQIVKYAADGGPGAVAAAVPVAGPTRPSWANPAAA